MTDMKGEGKMRITKRIVSFLLSLCLICGLLPNFALASNAGNVFRDVKQSDWFYDAVQYVYDNGLMNGTESDEFSPFETTTRAMIVTILYRLEGEPTTTGSEFWDVDLNSYYSDAVAWAATNNIVNGVGLGRFEPDDPVTREQIAAILYRFMQYKEYDIVFDDGSLYRFVDSTQISQYAVTAMQWANTVGLITGVTSVTLDPGGFATRDQIATVLMRFCEDILSTSNKYTVSFSYNYGNQGIYDTEIVSEDEVVQRPDNPRRSGYSFKGWYTEASGGDRFDFDTPITQDTTLYAHWSRNSSSSDDDEPTNENHIVSFEPNAEDVTNMPDAQTLARGSSATYPGMPSREGYTFAGWYLNKNETDLSNQYDFSQAVTNDTILYAQWINIDIDTDGDQIPDDLEGYFGSDPSKADTDGDGLSDYQECIVLGTSPSKQDTDGNSVNDNNEDADGDNLSNGLEFQYDTNPIAVDTDLDGLTDGEEVNTHKTDANVQDTDSDGATDFWEVENKFNPTEYNTSFQTTTEVQSAHVKAAVTTNLPGEKAETLEVAPAVDHPILTSDMPGYIDAPFEFSVEGNLDGYSATISFSFDNETISDDFIPCIYYYDEETQILEELPTTVSGNVASTTVSHFSTYILLNKVEFDKVWETEIAPPITGGEGSEDAVLDIMFVIDYSSSMKENDPDQMFKDLSEQFVGKLREGIDQAGAVKYIATASLVSGLTSDKQSVVDSIKSIGYDSGYNSNSGTNGSAGIKIALDELDKSESEYQYIIFITDGEDNRSSYSYTSLADRASKSGVVIYAIGMGSANESNLKTISSNTGGKYYHATTDMDATDLINLDDVFDDIESETVDLTADSDSDGIPDYYEQSLSSGSGVPIRLDPNDPDCDNDGLLDGEEVDITVTTDGRVYGKMLSNPQLYFSDSDGYNDYDEMKVYHSNPLVGNVAFADSDTSFLVNNENFVSNKYLQFYENDWYGWLEQASVWLGNNIFGSNYDTTYLYKSILMEYLKQMADEMEQTNEIREIVGLTHKIIKQMNDNVGSIYDYVNEDSKDLLDNLKQQLNTAQKNLDDIANGDLINAGYTKEQIYALWDETFAEYKDVDEKIPQLNSKIEFNTKISKISDSVGIVMDVADVVISGYDVYQDYATFAASLSGMTDCLDALNKISNSPDAPDELKAAANEVGRAIEEQQVDSIEAFLDIATAAGGKVGRIGIVAGMSKLPVVGKYVLIAEAALGITDFMFNISEVSEQCACLYAISKSATILANDFSDILEQGRGYSQWTNVYQGYQQAAEDYLALAIIRRTSEGQMKNADEANSFLIEWLFTEFMYKVDDIQTNVEKIDDIKYNYVGASAA